MKALLLVSLWLAGTVMAATPTYTTTDWKSNRLTPLAKITVGPWDNFEASVDRGDNRLFYTRDRIQIPRIYSQDLKSNKVKLFIGENGDAKDPALGPGSRLAFTSYHKDANGDICHTPLSQEPQIQCITGSGTVDQSPFWIDAGHLGFLSREPADRQWRLRVYDFSISKTRDLDRGIISSAVAAPGGRYVVYNKVGEDGAIAIRVHDLRSGRVMTPPPFDLSGINGFMAFSPDGKYLYFNHYLNDTNLDQVIDGNDNSVAFRVPFQAWLNAGEAFFPEQLTSVANNCKFPATTERFLYLTCAFEGSLDIYRLPLTGSVPVDWTEKKLWEAHLTARDYESRLLILNTLRYRFKIGGVSMLERLLSNHLQLGELTAASFYLARISRHYADSDANVAVFYEVLQQYLKVRSSKQRVPVGMITAKFQNLVKKQRSQIEQSKGWPALITLMRAYLHHELDENEKALAALRGIRDVPPLMAMERFLRFDLYRRLLPGRKLLPRFEAMYNAREMPLESRLYYAFEYLKTLQSVQPQPERRKAVLQKQLASVADERVAELFRSEILVLDLVQAGAKKDKKAGGQAQKAVFKKLSSLLKKYKSDTLVRKAMHTRAIAILGEAEQFQFMELLSRHWLLTTHVSEMEFNNAAEQYSVITMDKAYGMLARGDLAKAYGTFYSAILQTNDLEAHYQFVTMGRQPGLNTRIDQKKAYDSFARRNLLGSHLYYVQALNLLLSATPAGAKPDARRLDQALALLDKVKGGGINPAMRDLMSGYIYHLKMRAGRQRYKYDKALFQKAHHHYMLALDLGKENSRISAAIWENLAWLHFEAGNYALSADFFQQRARLPFVDVASEIRVRWWLARSLFYNQMLEEAWQASEKVLKLADGKGLPLAAYRERTAFYAMQAGKYRQALDHYEKLLAGGFSKTPSSNVNMAKITLSHAYVLWRLGDKKKAAQHFKRVLALSDKLSPQPADSNRLVSFQPNRLRWLALGFLARLQDDPGQQAQLRDERARIWRRMAGKAAEFAMDEDRRLSALAKDLNLAAAAREKAGDLKGAALAMRQALRAAGRWASDRGDSTGPVIYRTMINYLSMGISHRNMFRRKEDNALLQKNVESALDGFSKSGFLSPFAHYQRAKLEILWQGYQKEVLGADAGLVDRNLSKVMARPQVVELKKAEPKWHAGLQRLAQNMQAKH